MGGGREPVGRRKISEEQADWKDFKQVILENVELAVAHLKRRIKQNVRSREFCHPEGTRWTHLAHQTEGFAKQLTHQDGGCVGKPWSGPEDEKLG